jgi:hypothetical protein
MVAMKETELRLGNSINLHGEECTVRAIGKGNITIGAEGYKSERVSINSIKPIPLTEEWLVKFGFSRRENIHKKGKFKIIGGIAIFGIKQTKAFYYKDIQLKHVHQLQNLYFALTNKELET